MKKRTILFFLIISFFFSPLLIKAEDILGQSISFYIESSYDTQKRERTEASLRKISQKAYWYLDDDWWDGLEQEEKVQMAEILDFLGEEFDTKIYPILTQNFGSEWSPGIDDDFRITILIHPMTQEAGGYFNSADEYYKSQVSTSNQREMIYFNALHLDNPLAKSFLAHEFQHLISFNQKERVYNVSEEVWLNEARSEYVATLLGYNDDFEGSNLQRRIKNFLAKPYDSLTEWKNLPYDYGVVSLFVHYLVDHYDKNILVYSLQSPKSGIESLNYALSKSGFQEDFSDVFTDWTIAVLVNNCSFYPKYCYLNSSLRNFKLTPLINYLPSIGKSVLSVTNTTKDWAGNWHKFVGGNGALEVDFSGTATFNFKVPYVIESKDGNFQIAFLGLNGEQKGTIYVEDFGSENIALTIIPSLQNKISGFSDLEPSVSFFWSASNVGANEGGGVELIDQLLRQVEELQKEIARLRAQLDAILGKEVSCQNFSQNLYYGLRNDNQVECLQQFLKSQGSDIYPEGLVTGNFLSLTQNAVIRFQEKYSNEILKPIGLTVGTGFVGPMTRAKINQLLSQ